MRQNYFRLDEGVRGLSGFLGGWLNGRPFPGGVGLGGGSGAGLDSLDSGIALSTITEETQEQYTQFKIAKGS